MNLNINENMSAINKIFEGIKKIINRLTGTSVEVKQKYNSAISPDSSPKQRPNNKGKEK